MAARSLLLLALGLLVAAWGGPEAAAQSASRSASPPHPVRLTALYPPAPAVAGTWGTYRVRIAPDVPLPVRYVWDFGDGSMSSGPVVAYAYDRPGTYSLTVTAHNAHGSDTLQTALVVVSPDEARRAVAGPPPVTAASGPIGATSRPADEARAPRRSFDRSSLLGSGGVSLAAGGYTWVVASSLHDRPMRFRSLDYRLRGYRAGVFATAADSGSTAYRVVLGQFDTTEAALAARSALPADATPAWLVSVDDLTDDLPPLAHQP
jgi:PKD repeat protein